MSKLLSNDTGLQEQTQISCIFSPFVSRMFYTVYHVDMLKSVQIRSVITGLWVLTLTSAETRAKDITEVFPWASLNLHNKTIMQRFLFSTLMNTYFVLCFPNGNYIQCKILFLSYAEVGLRTLYIKLDS